MGKNNRCPQGNFPLGRFTETTPVPGATPEQAKEFMSKNGVNLGYPKTDDGGGFFRGATSFKFNIPTSGTGRSAILAHPTPSETSGCIGIYTDRNLTGFRDTMINNTSGGRTVPIHVP
jgi:hypothetical protein